MGRSSGMVRLGILLVVALSAGGCAADPTVSPAPGTTTFTPIPSAEAGSPSPAGTFDGTVILGSPTDRSVVASVASASPVEIYVEHGPASGAYTARTSTVVARDSIPVELVLDGLEADAPWYYRLRFRALGAGEFLAGSEASFHTQRSSGATFSFAVEADPHIGLDEKADPDLFRAALEDVRADHPDFLIDLGDTFMGDKIGAGEERLEAAYVSLREAFGISGPTVPLYLVNGNHDGEAGWSLAGDGHGIGARATSARRLYYPNPERVAFYSGAATDAIEGLRDSSYAWEWGDALFVVLDPYSSTPRKPGPAGDLWDWTLGQTQHAWLENVLASSTKPYKLVFSHHLIGDVRGGVAQAGGYEWGGNGADGSAAFGSKRPGWSLPVHDLFVRYGVTIFFQGHDHLYAREELDGVVYQTVPQPATVGGDVDRVAAEYGYASGVNLPSPGYLRVTVAPSGVTVDYIHTGLDGADRSGHTNGAIVYSYTAGGVAETGDVP